MALWRTPTPVPMGQSSCLPSVSSHESSGVGLAHPENLGGLWDGNLEFQDVVKHVESRLFPLIQSHIPHGWTFLLGS